MIQIERFTCNMLGENCYVVSDETKECVIIDCGALYDEENSAIADYIKGNGLKPVHLLVTHGHLDHNFGNAMILEKYGLKPELSASDERLINNLGKQAEQFYQMTLDIPVPPIGRLFDGEGETVTFGSHQFTVIETPGHSRGSICFYCEQEQAIFTGDTLFQNSIGRTDLGGGSMMQIIQSLRILAQLPDQTRVFPGHGAATTIGQELAHNPYMDR